MKVYFAATYSMREQLVKYAEDLRAAGIEVTSRWLEEQENPHVQISDLPAETHVFYGTRDIEDAYAADVLVSFNDSERHFRQGRTAEFGMFIMLNHLYPKHPRTILVVGEDREHIFHYQPNVFHFPNWDATKQMLLEAVAVERA